VILGNAYQGVGMSVAPSSARGAMNLAHSEASQPTSRNSARTGHSVGPFPIGAYPGDTTTGVDEAYRRVGGARVAFRGRRAGVTA